MTVKRKKDGRPRAARNEGTAKQQAFARHFGANGDRVAAVEHAYPASVNWSTGTKHAHAARLLRLPYVIDVINQVRAPVLATARMSFDSVLYQAEENFYRLLGNEEARKGAPIEHAREIRQQLESLVKLHAIEELRRVNSSDTTLEYDGKVIKLDDLSSGTASAILDQLNGTGTAAQPAPPGGEGVPAPFRDVYERIPPGAAPPDAVRHAPEGDRGEDPPSDGVHAAGGSEVDVLKRLSAGMERREIPRDCPHCGKPHDGTCPGFRL